MKYKQIFFGLGSDMNECNKKCGLGLPFRQNKSLEASGLGFIFFQIILLAKFASIIFSGFYAKNLTKSLIFFTTMSYSTLISEMDQNSG